MATRRTFPVSGSITGTVSLAHRAFLAFFPFEVATAELRVKFIHHGVIEGCREGGGRPSHRLQYDCPHTLFYLDPPYWGTQGYGVEFGLEQYSLMAELARTIKGKMIISVNDIPEMRKVFEGLQMATAGVTYSLGDNRQ